MFQKKKQDMAVVVEVSGYKFDGTMRDVVSIDKTVLTDEFIEQPSTYAWWATLYEYASADLERKELSISVLHATLDAEKRLELVQRKEKITDKIVEAAIIRDPLWLKANEALIELRRRCGLLKSVVDSLKQRKDMLIQIGSMFRQEMGMDIGVNLRKVRDTIG